MTPPRAWLLFAGPPFGPPMWAEVVARLGSARAVDLLDAPDGTLESMAEVAVREPGWSESVVVAHGGAAPVIIAAALRSPPRGVVLSNGPIRHADAVTRTLGRALTMGAFPLVPAVWLPFLRSSVALRRAVNNPYVMDRDTVAALCGGTVADSARRGRLRTWIRALSGPLPDPRELRCRTGIVWGDADRLNPTVEADWFEAAVSGSVRVDIAGGRFAHPVERPWAFADALTRIVDVWEEAARPGHQSHA